MKVAIFMFEKVSLFIINYNLGDWASILGFFIVIVGFVITIRKAQQASKAAEEAKKHISTWDSITEFSSVMSVLEEIKRLHRNKAWQILPDRYSSLRKSLITIRTNSPKLTNDQKKTIQSTIQHLSNIEILVDRSISSKTEPDIAHLNKRITSQIEALHEIVMDIKGKLT